MRADSRSALRPGVRLLGRLMAGALIAGLTVFHGQLLWQRITSLSLLDLPVALRWGAAALLLAGLIYLQRTGISLFHGRRALVLWLLVLLLHAGSMPAAGGQPQLVAESGLLLALAFSSLALRHILVQRAGRTYRLAPLYPVLRDAPAAPPCEPGLLEPLSPRPPPARAIL